MEIMTSSAFCVFLFSICWNLCFTENVEICGRDGGNCIKIYECSPLYNLIKGRPLSDIPEADRNLLKRHHCGFLGQIPKVCCNETLKEDQESIPDDVLPSFSIIKKLLPSDCGEDTSRRIHGGEQTDLDEFPWMAIIKHKSPSSPLGHYLEAFKCGGVLISKRYVLTAAHCLNVSYPDWKLSVTLGEYNMDSTKDCIYNRFITECLKEPPQEVSVEAAMAHENFNIHDRNLRHDIAVLRLSRDVKFSDYVKPICLPVLEEERKKTHFGANMTIAGWGITEHNTTSSVKLKLVVPVVSTDECNYTYNIVNISLNDRQLCAGGAEDKNSCRGDSGGPLMTVSTDEYGVSTWHAVGIVSFGPDPCGLLGWPSVYTRISKYMGWIVRHMKE